MTHADALPATGERTCQRRTILRKRSRSTTSRIIDRDKNSAYLSLHILPCLLTRCRLHRFQKAIKKVRAVQRMRRNRGFAFSQTENASRQDQERMIRAYDTSKTGARPSGY